LKTLAAGAIGTAVGGTGLAFDDRRPRISITIDDFNISGLSEAEALRRSRALLSALRAQSSLKAAAFVCTKYANNGIGRALLREWGESGHIVANHTHAHRSYHDCSYEEFSGDILRAESILEAIPGFRRYFRFPMLKEGDTPLKRDRMRAFLAQHGYRMGYVTVDASDWYIDRRLRDRIARNAEETGAAYRDFYLDHLRERAAYYDGLSRRVLGRSVSHTLLIHFNLLNELFLGDVLDMFAAGGWRLVDAGTAFKDAVFSATPDVVPAGESILWALAKASGKYADTLRYPAEDGRYEEPKMDRLGL
jgi:peptidoglycan/xylan/chitin deacetylase (PgdA/CDA1 family)